MRRSELQALLNALVTDRNDLIDEVKRLHTEANALIKGVEKDASFTDDERETRLVTLRAERKQLRELHDVALTDEFVPAHKAARDAFYADSSSSTEAAELYAVALKIFEDAYLVVHPKGTPTKKTAPVADDKAGKSKGTKTDVKTDPKPAPAPKADEDDGKSKKAKDDTDPAKKPAPKADDKAGTDVTDIAGLAALIKSGQDECRDGFTAVNARITEVAKGTLPEDIAKLIRDAGADRVKAILEGSATAATLSDEDRALLDELRDMMGTLRLLHSGLNPYTNAKVIDMIQTLAGLDKFGGGLLHFIGGSKRDDTHTN